MLQTEGKCYKQKMNAKEHTLKHYSKNRNYIEFFKKIWKLYNIPSCIFHQKCAWISKMNGNFATGQAGTKNKLKKNLAQYKS